MAGTAKAYNLTLDYVLYSMSFANIIMYGAVLPSYSPKGKDKGRDEGRDRIKADDPANKELVRKFLDSVE